MIWLDVVTLALFFLLVMVVTAVMLAAVFRYAYHKGEEVGELREQALSWERLASAQSCVEAQLRKMEAGDDWPAEIDKE